MEALQSENQRLLMENERLREIVNGVKALVLNNDSSNPLNTTTVAAKPSKTINTNNQEIENMPLVSALPTSPILDSGKRVNRRLLFDNPKRQELDKPDSDKWMESKKSQSKKDNGPSYAYQETVRGNKRKALPGHDCSSENYYTTAGITKTGINKCSKHRAAVQRPKTPPGFWSLDFPSTPELRARQAALPSPDKFA